MHTFTGPDKTTFNFNSDFSGNVSIQAPDGTAIAVPGSDVLHFVDLIARRLIASAIDDATGIASTPLKD